MKIKIVSILLITNICIYTIDIDMRIERYAFALRECAAKLKHAGSQHPVQDIQDVAIALEATLIDHQKQI